MILWNPIMPQILLFPLANGKESYKDLRSARQAIFSEQFVIRNVESLVENLHASTRES